ncbi:hypothetical protein ACIBVL_16970 [Streptomyces sp. NPDC049687]|uniref:hypothetical protein n=1 Tax=Streptomyces sp. NPDC049687 TaxID=3365596 RepID=UPI00378D58B2
MACAGCGVRRLGCRGGGAGRPRRDGGRGVDVRLTPAVDTVWPGGSVDRNRANDRLRVLVLDTGDAYYF